MIFTEWIYLDSSPTVYDVIGRPSASLKVVREEFEDTELLRRYWMMSLNVTWSPLSMSIYRMFADALPCRRILLSDLVTWTPDFRSFWGADLARFSLSLHFCCLEDVGGVRDTLLLSLTSYPSYSAAEERPLRDEVMVGGGCSMILAEVKNPALVILRTLDQCLESLVTSGEHRAGIGQFLLSLVSVECPLLFKSFTAFFRFFIVWFVKYCSFVIFRILDQWRLFLSLDCTSFALYSSSRLLWHEKLLCMAVVLSVAWLADPTRRGVVSFAGVRYGLWHAPFILRFIVYLDKTLLFFWIFFLL